MCRKSQPWHRHVQAGRVVIISCKAKWAYVYHLFTTPEDQRAAFAAAECFDPVMDLAFWASDFGELRQRNDLTQGTLVIPPGALEFSHRRSPIKAQDDLLSGQWRLGAAAASSNVPWWVGGPLGCPGNRVMNAMARPRAGCCAAAAAKRLLATCFQKASRCATTVQETSLASR